MSDIFISYKKEDAGRVVRIVEALRSEGFSVWWDHGIAPGANWDQTIQNQLNVAKVVVAVWSEASVNAPWVKEESNVGKNRGILVPVMIDKVDPPLGFSLIQAADLIGWAGDKKDPRWTHVMGAIKAVLSGEAQPMQDKPVRKRGLPAVAIIGGLVALTMITLGLVLMTRNAPTAPGQPAQPSLTLPGQPAPPAQADANEQKLWDKATESKMKSDFQSYLLAYPNGFYVNRVKDILLTCRLEKREVWKKIDFPLDGTARGVASVPSDGKTREAACNKAKADATAQGKLNCEVLNGPSIRNATPTILDRPCECNETGPGSMVCIADLLTKCIWEGRLDETVEICG
jgi:hypothetical protein